MKAEKPPFWIVLTDDDEDDREIFQNALEEVSPETRLILFENGADLLDALKQENNKLPDILFLDINMPVKNGFDTLAAIRQSEKLAGLCIIMYSTSDNGADIEKAQHAGANGYVQKPYSHKNLKAVLTKILAMDWKNPCEVLDEQNFVLTAGQS